MKRVRVEVEVDGSAPNGQGDGPNALESTAKKYVVGVSGLRTIQELQDKVGVLLGAGRHPVTLYAEHDYLLLGADPIDTLREDECITARLGAANAPPRTLTPSALPAPPHLPSRTLPSVGKRASSLSSSSSSSSSAPSSPDTSSSSSSASSSSSSEEEEDKEEVVRSSLPQPTSQLIFTASHSYDSAPKQPKQVAPTKALPSRQAQQQASATAPSPVAASTAELRLFIGNLPKAVDGEALKAFLNGALLSRGKGLPGNEPPVIHVNRLGEKSFAFADLATADSMQHLLSLDGELRLDNRALKIAPTKGNSAAVPINSTKSNTSSGASVASRITKDAAQPKAPVDGLSVSIGAAPDEGTPVQTLEDLKVGDALSWKSIALHPQTWQPIVSTSRIRGRVQEVNRSAVKMHLESGPIVTLLWSSMREPLLIQ